MGRQLHVLGRDHIEYKSVAQILLMRRAGLVVADALDAVRDVLRPGATTAELDAVAEGTIRSCGAVPSFLGYQDYPATVCVSVNDEIVHGIPGPRAVQVGDVVSVDCGAIVEGWHGDAAFTAIIIEGGVATPTAGDPPGAQVPGVDPADAALVAVTEQALWHGIAAIVAGERLNAVGVAVEDFVGDRYGIVEGYGGHGIGTAMHQDPHVLNYRTRDRGPRMRPGLCIAVEPMLVAGNPATRTLSDEWTVVTRDSSRAAHWEHSVALTESGPWVLTARDGGAGQLGALGVTVAPLAD